jgi:hypothetical protein
MQSPEFPALLDWLERDEIVKRFSTTHPQVYEHLRSLREMTTPSMPAMRARAVAGQ